ncbi:efflux RND transporter periplasmic adaptor subunit [Solimicrobium silvestre]|uniref:Efflux transporter, RND family, MFP subunit n=1 Tax=Solimicrobium silvestre TaxID=2099400 RepID=A0A2S9H503_9BURK|nr:efflux RND transporter periplasmic adaptor subunit [Solimicrobium silvestre]PRC94956.1 Efflux transporter, RND family, MFP subunit [Solimicrobium silvestre]
MNHPKTPYAVSGSAMDTVVRKSYRKQIIALSVGAVCVVALAISLWRWMPHGLQVEASELRMAVVERGIFLDEMVVRANATPLNSVILDAVESGRVEEVFVRDGTVVTQGTPLFRLSNPQRQIELLARQSDQATQISNISNLRAALAVSITDHERRLSDLQFNFQQAEKKNIRNKQLADKGFISGVALEESEDQLEQQRHVLSQEQSRSNEEMEIKRGGIAQMEQANARLASGLTLLNATIDALTVRAPTSGRLTDFHLQVGEAVAPNQHIGRIDDPVRYKLSAAVDEYYLNRVTANRQGKAQLNDQVFPVEVSRVYPQIDKGQFKIDMVFKAEQPAQLNPGQSLDTQIVLGDPKPALLLPTGAFINDSGGAWVFVVSPNGTTAERRMVKIGRRSNSQIEVVAGLAAGEKVIVSSYTGFGQATRLQLNN